MKALGFELKKTEIIQLIRENDRNGNDLMKFGDFNRISTLDSSQIVTEKIQERDPLDEIKKAFQLFDDDKTGKISVKNLKRVAKELGEAIDDEELQAMIDEFDLDNDGESKTIS